MGITHDPGPVGASGEGETVLVSICLSYVLAAYCIFSVKKTSSTSSIQLDQFELEHIEAPQVNVTEEVYANNSLHKDEETLKKLKSNDLEKSNLCKKNGVTLITIDFDVALEKVPELIKEKCAHLDYQVSGIDFGKNLVFLNPLINLKKLFPL